MFFCLYFFLLITSYFPLLICCLNIYTLFKVTPVYTYSCIYYRKGSAYDENIFFFFLSLGYPPIFLWIPWLFFYSSLILHLHVPHFNLPFFFWWQSNLLPFIFYPGYSSNKLGCACFLVAIYIFLWIYAQDYYCRIMKKVYFSFLVTTITIYLMTELIFIPTSSE